ncbi:MAG TPA: hypothetical protein VK988_02775 [Acidimicrobiales bacterium]|nr:hypothetical protein [Acidimicrobiales bacterium]
MADYLGHADPGFTLRVYAHLFPSSEERARKALDRLLGESRTERVGPTGVSTAGRRLRPDGAGGLSASRGVTLGP